MNTHVHLNPTRLAILSIPRDKYWLFTSSVLQLLDSESLRRGGYDSEASLEDEDDEEACACEENDNQDHINELHTLDSSHSDNISWPSANVSGNERNSSYSSGSDKPNGTANKVVDNSSKHGLGESWDSTQFADATGSKEHSRSNSRTISSSGSEITPQDDEDDDDAEQDSYFFHIAFTPVECTIICSASLVDTLFKNPLSVCSQLNYKDVELLEDDFLSLSVDTDGGFDSSLRILELTKPLSDNSISLFFLSSHFNDIVLIPYSARDNVIHILTKNNFVFSNASNSFVKGVFVGDNGSADYVEPGSYDTISASPFIKTNGASKSKDFDLTFDAKELERNTFRLFQDFNISPTINNNAKLLLTGARSGEVSNTISKAAKVLNSVTKIPSYFAITRTSINEVSLILPKCSKKRSRMGFDTKNIIGSVQDIIIPITIDFQKLPLDSTGIVAGVASRLISGFNQYNRQNEYVFEMNYLSMAKSGIIMIPQENVEIISSILKDKSNGISHTSPNSTLVDSFATKLSI